VPQTAASRCRCAAVRSTSGCRSSPGVSRGRGAAHPDRQQLADELRHHLDRLGFSGDALALIRKLSHEPYACSWSPVPPARKTPAVRGDFRDQYRQDKIITIEGSRWNTSCRASCRFGQLRKKADFAAPALDPAPRPERSCGRDPRRRDRQIRGAVRAHRHLVFTTVHANNVFDVIARFMHMASTLIARLALNGILAQRLVRVTAPTGQR